MVDAAGDIRDAVAHVEALRASQAGDPARLSALKTIKQLQAQRFRVTYADQLADRRHGPAARFFLEELYGDRDFSDRDAQFQRIAGAIQRVFPASVVTTAVAMARLHQLTETLDDAMATVWLAQGPGATTAARYIQAWRGVGQRANRQTQLVMVLGLGRDLDKLTRKFGLRSALKLMRQPAAAAGLAALQGFLERGFDTFAEMRGAADFLGTVEQREARWIATLFDAGQGACEAAISGALGHAGSDLG